MNNIVKTISLLIAVFVGTSVSSLYAQNEATKGLLYEITGNGLKKPSYLYGTFHLLNSDYLKENPKIEECLTKAKGVVVEMDIDKADIPALQAGMLMKDQTLSGLLTKDEMDKLDAKIHTATGMGIELFDKMKPLAIMAMMATDLPADATARIEKYKGEAMDLYFTHKGKEKKKTVTQLETGEEQMDLLMGAPIDEQVDLLKKYITTMDSADTLSNKLLDLYFGQDLGGLYKLSTDYPEQIGNMKKLLDDRNNRWMVKLPVLMKKESQFIAVGALHLAGPAGLVNQLRNAGYTVKPVE